MKRVMMLKYFQIEPVLVFDGRPLPLKASVNTERRRLTLNIHSLPFHPTPLIFFLLLCFLNRMREENKAKGLEMIRKGDRKAALEFFQKSSEVSSRLFIHSFRLDGEIVFQSPRNLDDLPNLFFLFTLR
jgi:5'-3' exonuclease